MQKKQEQNQVKQKAREQSNRRTQKQIAQLESKLTKTQNLKTKPKQCAN